MSFNSKTMGFGEDDMVDDEMYSTREEESDSEAESYSGSEDEVVVRLPEPSMDAIYNRDGLLDKLQDISWPENIEWTHKLIVEIDEVQDVDVNDDLTRELAFYTQALEGARQGFEKLKRTVVLFFRSSECCAEMGKSDVHMEKVKSQVLHEKKQIEEADEGRKDRESKLLSKEIQVEKLKGRAKEKKEGIESVKKWRKQRQQNGFADKDGEFDFDFEDEQPFRNTGKKRPGVLAEDRSGGKGRQGGVKSKTGRKREFRDSKFGFGGRKGFKKQNNVDSTNDFKGFNRRTVGGNKRRKSDGA